MFATLLGALPAPPDADDVDREVELVIAAQAEAGIEPITDGRLRDPGFERLSGALIERATGRAGDGTRPRTGAGSVLTVDGWRFAAERTDKAVKQALPGPWTLLGRWSRRDRAAPDAGRARLLALADAVRAEVDGLIEAGCPLVEIEESSAHEIGDDEAAWREFGEAHRRLADGVEGTHLSLSIVGGAVGQPGIPTIVELPYSSLAVDLIAGPDNWHVARRWPGERGLIVGALSARDAGEPKEVLLWAAHYAASSSRRGVARVGLGSAGGWANLAWDAAIERMGRLAAAASLAGQAPSEELVLQLDPRAVSSRRAALGHGAGPRRSPKRRRIP